MLLWSWAAVHCKDVEGLPASLGCFLHTTARASFPSCSFCTFPTAQAQSVRGRGWGARPCYFMAVFQKSHLEMSLQLCYCSVQTEKKGKKKQTAAVWDRDQVFRQIYALELKDSFSKLVATSICWENKIFWTRLIVYILKFWFIRDNQVPVECRVVSTVYLLTHLHKISGFGYYQLHTALTETAGSLLWKKLLSTKITKNRALAMLRSTHTLHEFL